MKKRFFSKRSEDTEEEEEEDTEEEEEEEEEEDTEEEALYTVNIKLSSFLELIHSLSYIKIIKYNSNIYLA